MMYKTLQSKTEVIEEGKIDNKTVEVVYEDGSKEYLSIVKLGSRDEAIRTAIKLTKIQLKKDTAFEKLHTLCNNFDRHRNYEIEYYLNELTRKYYKIDELCPFNGFKWFD